MKREKVLSLVLALAFLVTGCNASKETTAESTALGSAEETCDKIVFTDASDEVKAAQEHFEFNPHVYSGKIAERIPKDYWDSFYNLCDSLRKGEDTFKCTSQDAFNWATDAAVLCNYFPAAGAKVEPAYFEDGIGKIRYNIPVEDFLKREMDFEVLITNILNSTIEKDDTEYERALKLYLYVANNYVYDTSLVENLTDDNFVYACFMEKRGMCVNFASIYAYLLLQVGVDAVNVGIYEENMCHSWTFVTIKGKSYHVDTTWALRSDDSHDILLDYFLMSDTERINDGCSVKNLDVSVFPEAWANKTSVSFAAPDYSYNLRSYCRFVSLDEKNKVVHYVDMYDAPQEFHYDM